MGAVARSLEGLPNKGRTRYPVGVPEPVRILLLADTHLGFDLPAHPRIERRRRGHDFLANYATALGPAVRGEVDLVVHAGDVFDRSRPLPSVAYQAFEPLRQVAERGVPVCIVPGNHERSRLPHDRFVSHRNVHVFDRPRTVVFDMRGTRLALAGFPYERTDVRLRFPLLLEETGWATAPADVRLLCMHHCVEGATVGPANFTFRSALDVIRAQDLPPVAAVLSGHIHRHQVLVRDLRGQPMPAPVLYPGSIERTALAEAGETKGYMVLEVTPGEAVRWTFHPLPTRPMIRAEVRADGMTERALAAAIGDVVATAPRDAVLSIRVTGMPSPSHWRVMSAARWRAIAPATMNIELVPVVRDGHAPLRQPA